MRLSESFAPTLRDDPAEAEAASHKLLLRAGFIRPVMSGVFTLLPLGLRTIRKIEAIVRDEMDRSGAQEIRMPIILPSEPWKQTGRWQAYGPVMFKLIDRHGRELGLGGGGHPAGRWRSSLVPRPAGEPVPGRVEVPR
jgi:prolyl-tRNA synthetase